MTREICAGSRCPGESTGAGVVQIQRIGAKECVGPAVVAFPSSSSIRCLGRNPELHLKTPARLALSWTTGPLPRATHLLSGRNRGTLHVIYYLNVDLSYMDMIQYSPVHEGVSSYSWSERSHGMKRHPRKHHTRAIALYCVRPQISFGRRLKRSFAVDTCTLLYTCLSCIVKSQVLIHIWVVPARLRLVQGRG